MGANSKIEWTEATWNPVRGCTRVSPGCGGPGKAGGCYAEGIAARFSGPGQAFEGFAHRVGGAARWTGKVELVPDLLDLPLRWRTPRMIFANSMSDLFHAALPLEDIAIVFGAAVAAVHLRHHTIQILTKRGDRMREVTNDERFWDMVNAYAGSWVMEKVDPLYRRIDDARATLDEYGPDKPPPRIWLGVSVEDQERADERIPALLETPATVRFLSCEPLLGPVEVSRMSGLDWVICGGESGPNARPMHPDWARSLRDQCAAAGIPFFFKQWGEWAPAITIDDEYDGPVTYVAVPDGKFPCSNLPGNPRVLEFIHGAWQRGGWYFSEAPEGVIWFGKRRSGRLLDGVEHNAYPGAFP